MRPQSRRATRSRGMKADTSQNSAVAPAARSVKSMVGVMVSEHLAISLHITMFIPKMMYAPAQARWPARRLFPVSSIARLCLS